MQDNSFVTNNLAITSLIIDEESFWFCCGWYNYLFRYDFRTKFVTKAIRIPFGSPFDVDSIVSMYKIDETIYLLPKYCDKGVVRYRIEENEIELLGVPFPIYEWGDAEDQDEEYIYFVLKNDNRIIKYDKSTYEIEDIIVETEGRGFSAIKKTKIGFWLVELGSGDVLLYEYGKGITRRIKNKPREYRLYYNGNYPCKGVWEENENLIVFPRHANMLYYIDKETEVATMIERYDDYDKESGPVFTVTTECNGNIWAYKNAYDRLCVSEGIKKKDEIIIRFSEEVLKMLMKQSLFSTYDVNDRNHYLEIERNKINTFNKFIEDIVV